MEQLINGRFEYEVPAFITSESEIHLKIPEGRNQKGEFSAGAEDGSRVKGVVTSDNRRIVLAKDKFSGSTSKITYGVDTRGLLCGETIEGNIVLSSNIGELKVPVTVQIEEVEIQSSKGQVRTLEDFTRLAMKDPREAFRLFTSDKFYRILNGKNCVYTALYKGMSHNPVTYQHMEEFLIAAHKKEAIVLSMDKDKKGTYQINHSQKDTLFIYKSTWGYVRMEVEAVGDFLEIEKKVVTTDDFIGRVYGLEYVVRKDKLGNGKKFGKIIIRNVHQTLEFEIEASIDQGERLWPKGLKKHKTLELARDYLSLQLHRLDYRTWFDKSVQSLGELTSAECMSSTLLFYEAYIYAGNENIPKAMELLWGFKEGSIPLVTPRDKGVYLYLAKMVNLLAPEKQDILPKIKAYIQQQPDDFFLAKILMEEDETYQYAPIQQLHLMERTFEMGCKNPLLYLQAYQVLERQEGLLRKLSPFMVQVLNFARKQGILNEALLKRAAYLSDNLKEFQESVYRLLSAGYSSFPNDEVLEAICKLVMKGRPVNREYFKWYSLAVSHEIRITRLYEYYIETMDEEYHEVLPQVIRMYFAYSNTLSARKRAFIYANVIRNKSLDKPTYINYKKAMAQFAKEQVMQGRINEDYAVIYQEFLTDIDSGKLAGALLKVLFTYKVWIMDKSIRSVIVCHDSLKEEQVYPVSEQCAYVNLYSGDAQILFEDEKKRRYGTTISFKKKKLMEERELARGCIEYMPRDTGLLLYLCKELPSQMDINSKSLQNYQTASESPAFTDEYRGVIRKKLLEYYKAHPSEKKLAAYLCTVDVQEYAKINRADTIAVLVEQELYEQAFSIITQWGEEGTDDTVLMKLASHMIVSSDFQEDEELVYLADYVLHQGKYDENILGYLCRYYVGSVERMSYLWKKAKGFELKSYELDERILVFSMYVREFPDCGEKILKSYILQQGKELVILAYLTYISCAYFMADRQTAPEFFIYLERTYERDWELDIICHLALLKYYSSCERLNEKQEQHAEELLAEFDRKGMRFAFFQKLPLHLIQAYQVEDKVFVEERFGRGSKVVIHYSLHHRDTEAVSFKSEPMRDVYQGIFTKEFLLFYGETLSYYLTVEKDGSIKTTPRRQIVLPGVDTGGRTRYKLLNQILAFKALGNQEAMEASVRQYLEQEAFAESAFHLMS